jgi:hypothetical protein
MGGGVGEGMGAASWAAHAVRIRLKTKHNTRFLFMIILPPGVMLIDFHCTTKLTKPQGFYCKITHAILVGLA